MALLTKIALDALAAKLDGLSGLPALRRNDLRVDEFTSIDGFGHQLAMADGDIVQGDTEQGEPQVYELAQQADILFAVAGEPGDARDAAVDAGIATIAAALWSDRDLGGACEMLDIASDITRDHEQTASAMPVEAVRFTLALYLSAPTPFG